MNTIIFVPMISSSAAWTFCNREIAFHNGLLFAAGKILTGYQKREEAISEMLKTQPSEPFALLRVAITNDTQHYLANKGWLTGTLKSNDGASLWTLEQDGSIYLAAPEKAELTMEIVPVPKPQFLLH